MSEAEDHATAGNDAIHRQNYDAAVASFTRALSLDPGYKDAVWGLAEAWHYKGDEGEALRWYRRYLELAPGHPEAAHMVAALGGGHAPPRAGEAYVRAVFDNFADDFDRLLTEELEYKAPRLLYDAVVAALPDGTGSLNVLDTGCGTGLAGELFRPLARRLEGIDLSREMIKEARTRGIYDSLRVGELTRALATTTARYDLIVAADVMVYFGDLAPPIRSAAEALAPGGLLGFTVEAREGADYALMGTGRYVHDPAYVRRTAEACGLGEAVGRRAVLRQESGVPVDGYVTVFVRT